jgi:hypothetical protein
MGIGMNTQKALLFFNNIQNPAFAVAHRVSVKIKHAMAPYNVALLKMTAKIWYAIDVFPLTWCQYTLDSIYKAT